DLVLMDLDMPGRGGLAAIREITAMRPQIPVIVLSATPEEESLVAAIEAGAHGYVPKSAPPQELLSAIATVLGGGIGVGPAGRRLLLERRRELRSARSSPIHDLPEQERVILAMVAAGYNS